VVDCNIAGTMSIIL